MTFPDDENGDVLRRMQNKGDDLTKPRDIDFTVVFADENSAGCFASHFKRLGLRTSIKFSATVKELPWDVIVVKNMVPSHQEIGEFEKELALVARPFGGRNDGWGCFSVNWPPKGNPDERSRTTTK